MPKAEVLPERVVAGHGAPETTYAGCGAKRRSVEAFKNFYEDVKVVIDAKLGSFLFLVFCYALLLHVFVGVCSALLLHGFVGV